MLNDRKIFQLYVKRPKNISTLFSTTEKYFNSIFNNRKIFQLYVKRSKNISTLDVELKIIDIELKNDRHRVEK